MGGDNSGGLGEGHGGEAKVGGVGEEFAEVGVGGGLPKVEDFRAGSDGVGEVECVVEYDGDVGDFHGAAVHALVGVQVVDFHFAGASGGEVGGDSAFLVPVEGEGDGEAGVFLSGVVGEGDVEAVVLVLAVERPVEADVADVDVVAVFGGDGEEYGFERGVGGDGGEVAVEGLEVGEEEEGGGLSFGEFARFFEYAGEGFGGGADFEACEGVVHLFAGEGEAVGGVVGEEAEGSAGGVGGDDVEEVFLGFFEEDALSAGVGHGEGVVGVDDDLLPGGGGGGVGLFAACCVGGGEGNDDAGNGKEAKEEQKPFLDAGTVLLLLLQGFEKGEVAEIYFFVAFQAE